MKTNIIDNIELKYLTIDDFAELKEATLESYGGVLNSYWKEHHIEDLTAMFPEGQVIIKIDGDPISTEIIRSKHTNTLHISDIMCIVHVLCIMHISHILIMSSRGACDAVISLAPRVNPDPFNEIASLCSQ